MRRASRNRAGSRRGYQRRADANHRRPVRGDPEADEGNRDVQDDEQALPTRHSHCAGRVAPLKLFVEQTARKKILSAESATQVAMAVGEQAGTPRWRPSWWPGSRRPRRV